MAIIDLRSIANTSELELFEAYSASITVESYRTNWNPESDNRRKGGINLIRALHSFSIH